MIRAVQTNGIGRSTTAHLNLTKDMSAQVAAEVADKARHLSGAARNITVTRVQVDQLERLCR